MGSFAICHAQDEVRTTTARACSLLGLVAEHECVQPSELLKSMYRKTHMTNFRNFHCSIVTSSLERCIQG